MREEDELLVVLVGLPRSGKSTWARVQGYPVVCPDAIRLALHGQRFVRVAESFVWAIAEVMVDSLFRAGHKRVILDGCHVKRKYRQQWVDEGCAPGRYWRTVFKVIDTPASTCVERARGMNDTEIIPIIDKMSLEWETMGDDEKRYDA